MFMCVRTLLIYHRRLVVTHRSFHCDIQTVVKKKNHTVKSRPFLSLTKSYRPNFCTVNEQSRGGHVPTGTKHFPKLNFGSTVFWAGHVCRCRRRRRGTSARLEMHFACIDCKYKHRPGCPSTATNIASISFLKAGKAERF